MHATNLCNPSLPQSAPLHKNQRPTNHWIQCFVLCSAETLMLAQELVQLSGLECGHGLYADWSAGVDWMWIARGLE